MKEKKTTDKKKAAAEQPAADMIVSPHQHDGLVNLLMKSGPFGIITVGPDGKITFISPVAGRILGLKTDRTLGEKIDAVGLHAPDTHGKTPSPGDLPFGKVKAGGKPLYDERYIVVRPDGQQVHLSIHAEPVFAEAGEFSGMVAIIEDISGRKKAEEQLVAAKEEAEQKAAEAQEGKGILDAFMEHIPEGLTIARAPDAVTVRSSKYALDLLTKGWSTATGLSIEDWLERVEHYLADGVTPAGAEDLPLWRAVRHGETVIGKEIVLRRPDGEPISALCNAGPIFDEQGKITGGIVAWRDITRQKQAEDELRRHRDHLEELVGERTTELEESSRKLQEEVLERRKAEEAIRKSEEQYRLVVDNANEGIIIAQDGMFRYVNPRMAEMIGHTPEELISKPFADFIHPEDRDTVVDRHLKRIAGHKLPGSYTFRILDREGNIKWLEINAIRIDLFGKPATLNFCMEITERIRVEEEKKKVEAQLAQAQRIEALDRFAGGIAHDLNNILYPIIINVEELLDEEPQGSFRHDILTQTLKAANRQKDLVRKILSFGRRSEQNMQPIRVGSLLEETIAFVRSTIPSTIEIRYAIDAASDLILGDHIQIQQVIMNLCRNAADALESQKGVIEVRLHNTRLELVHAQQKLQPGEYLQLEVRDTGHGMKPEVMDRIFEPFFTTKGVGQGTGMGLSVAHGIVKSHGGVITVESKEGKGTLFTVCLPVLDGETQARAYFADRSGPSLQGKESILLVDDEELVLSSLQRALKMSGYRVSALKDGREAVRAFEKSPDEFDLVITDLTMPGMTGIELSRKILDIRPDIPVILCTGFNDAVDDQEARSLGIRELLLKPAGSTELKNAIRRVLEKGYSPVKA